MSLCILQHDWASMTFIFFNLLLSDSSKEMPPRWRNILRTMQHCLVDLDSQRKQTCTIWRPEQWREEVFYLSVLFLSLTASCAGGRIVRRWSGGEGYTAMPGWSSSRSALCSDLLSRSRSPFCGRWRWGMQQRTWNLREEHMTKLQFRLCHVITVRYFHAKVKNQQILWFINKIIKMFSCFNSQHVMQLIEKVFRHLQRPDRGLWSRRALLWSWWAADPEKPGRRWRRRPQRGPWGPGRTGASLGEHVGEWRYDTDLQA